MTSPIFISPRYLELLAQRMRNAGIRDIQIKESDWINRIKDAINATGYRAGIDSEFAEAELKLARMRIEQEDVDRRAEEIRPKDIDLLDDPVLRAFIQDGIVQKRKRALKKKR